MTLYMIQKPLEDWLDAINTAYPGPKSLNPWTYHWVGADIAVFRPCLHVHEGACCGNARLCQPAHLVQPTPTDTCSQSKQHRASHMRHFGLC